MASNLDAPPNDDEIMGVLKGTKAVAPEDLDAPPSQDEIVAHAPQHESLMRRAGRAAAGALDTADRYVGSVSSNPIKAGLNSYAQHQDFSRAVDDAWDKFGRPGAPRVSGSEVMRNLGVPDGKDVEVNTGFNPHLADYLSPRGMAKATMRGMGGVVTGQEDPDGIKLTPAKIAGTALDTAVDPLTYAPSLVSKGLSAAGGAAGIGESAASLAEERAFKAATGQNIAQYRRAAKVSSRGGRSSETAMDNVRAVGRQLLDNNAVGWASNPAGVGQRVEPLLRQSGENIGAIADAIDQRYPAGKVSGQDIANGLVDYGAGIPSMPETKALHDRVVQSAEHYENVGPMTMSQAQDYKNQYKYKHGDPGAFESSQDVTNRVKGIVGGAMDNAVVGEPEAAAYANEKKKYGAFAGIAEGATDRTLKDQSNRWYSPTDHLAGAGGAAKAAMQGHGNIITSIAGLAAATVNKQIRTRGSAFAANALDNIAKGLATYDNLPSGVQTLLEQATKRGANAVIVTHQLLMNSDPDYRAHFEGDDK